MVSQESSQRRAMKKNLEREFENNASLNREQAQIISDLITGRISREDIPQHALISLAGIGDRTFA